ncbi:MAG: hypothetical protein JEY94_00970 [Melioribacteraceae bacterium]|nr:hypothetical protein [Melioribacteraceae bacterium]
MGKIIVVALILFVLALIAISFYFARRYALICKKCDSRATKRTGNTRKIERNRRALIASPLPSKSFEYKCENCGYIFWSSIEGIYDIY